MLLEFKEKSDVMVNSWKRCLNYGLKPTDPFDDQLITGNRIHELIKEKRQYEKQIH